MSDRGLHRVEDELGETWLERWLEGNRLPPHVSIERWLESGLQQLEAYLAKHAAFLAYLDTAEQH